MYDTCDEVTPGSWIASQRKIWFTCSFQCCMFKMHTAFKLDQVHWRIVVLVLNYFQGHVVQEDDCLTLKRKALHNPLKAVELLTQQCCITSQIHSFIQYCLTTGPKPPPKLCLHIVRSRASSFKWEYPLLSLRSSSSFLRHLATSISPFIFPSITCFRRQFLRKMWPIQLAFRFLISCRIFLYSLTLINTCSFLTWSVQLIFFLLNIDLRLLEF